MTIAFPSAREITLPIGIVARSFVETSERLQSEPLAVS